VFHPNLCADNLGNNFFAAENRDKPKGWINNLTAAIAHASKTSR
jgi:hypothetical protein